MYHSLLGKVDFYSLKPGLITLAFVFAGAGYAAGSQLAGSLPSAGQGGVAWCALRMPNWHFIALQKRIK